MVVGWNSDNDNNNKDESDRMVDVMTVVAMVATV